MLAELLVHESSHEHLYLATELEPLDDGSDTELYWSPVKRTGRPISRILTTLSGESLSRVLEVAELTGLTDMLARLPMGVETLVSAAGGNLSAGQRQLILLTAAFATRAPVVLLDEATSQLDSAARARIRWQELGQGRTIVSVQHR